MFFEKFKPLPKQLNKYKQKDMICHDSLKQIIDNFILAPNYKSTAYRFTQTQTALNQPDQGGQCSTKQGDEEDVPYKQ